MNKSYRCFLFFLLAPSLCSALNIGVLEYSEYQTQQKNKEFSHSVRAIFYTKDNKWVTGDQTKGTTKWRVLYDGKIVGHITSDDNKTPKYISDKGLQIIASNKKDIPAIGSITDEFATWTDAKTYRPLVLTTGENYKDPDGWKKTELTTKIEKLAKVEFRSKFNEVINCTDEHDTKPKVWNYTDEDIKILKAYTSKTSWIVASLKLGPYKCDGLLEDSYIPTWFLFSPKGKVSVLDSGMTFVDAGDYDGDGKSEIIFQVSRYNKGGYIMYFDDFKQNVDFMFGYH